jgi:hypothetical protein
MLACFGLPSHYRQVSWVEAGVTKPLDGSQHVMRLGEHLNDSVDLTHGLIPLKTPFETPAKCVPDRKPHFWPDFQ